MFCKTHDNPIENIFFLFSLLQSVLWLILFESAWCTDLLLMKVSNHTTESYWSEGRVVVMVKEINHCCLAFYRKEQSQTRSNLLNNTVETNSVIARTEANNICLIRHFPISGETQYKELCVSGASRKCPWLKNIKVKLTLTRWENIFTNVFALYFFCWNHDTFSNRKSCKM